MRFALLVVLSVVMMVLDHRFHAFDLVRTTLATALYPMQWVASAPGTALSWLNHSALTREALRVENQRLRAQEAQLMAQTQRLRALEAENAHLRELKNAGKMVGGRVLIANVLSVDSDPQRRQVILGRGTRDGVYVGQPVLDHRGVMGQVMGVSPWASTVLLVSDRRHGIPVLATRSGLRAIVWGTGDDQRLTVAYVLKNADIQPGDVLVSSGLDGRFPPHYPVATVTSVEHDPEQHFARISAVPVARLGDYRDALLVWPVSEPASQTASPSTQAPAVESPSESTDEPAESAPPAAAVIPVR